MQARFNRTEAAAAAPAPAPAAAEPTKTAGRRSRKPTRKVSRKRKMTRRR